MEMGRRGRRLRGVYSLRLDAERLSSGEFEGGGSVIESPGGYIVTRLGCARMAGQRRE